MSTPVNFKTVKASAFFTAHEDYKEMKKDKLLNVWEGSNGEKVIIESTDPVDGWYVLKNADFTEGRGPMVFHKVFKTLDSAVSYIMKQDGIYGSKQYCTVRASVNIDGEAYAYNQINGYDLKPFSFE